MTPKHVHFSETNLVYSPLPTPSPTFSEESLPSSPGPETPSPLNPYHSSLPTTDCEPPFTTGPVRIHHILGFDENPPIEYNLNLHPSFITTTTSTTSSTLSQRPLSSFVLLQPATIPPLPSLNLIADRFPWTITIHASASRDSCVTVQDVLCTLHSTLRLPVTAAEFDNLPSLDDMIRVNEAYENRFGVIADSTARAEEEIKGVKRVDFLMGRKFLGLSSTTFGQDFWFINVL